MEAISEILKALRSPKGALGLSCDEYMINKMNAYNNSTGNLTEYECAKCKNRGYFMEYKNGAEFLRECDCMEIRRSIRRMEASGLSDIMRRNTFDSFKANEGWQKSILETAKDYVNNSNGKWFYIGGQVGSGKTHICTAIVIELLNKGMSAKYMLWRDEVVRIKSVINDDEEYPKAIGHLKTVKVLYIDDFFKTERGKNPTTSEINIAFEILNYRYNNKNLITIISSECVMDRLLDIDEAVGSRIYQRSRGYCLNISPDIGKNYRLNY